MVADRVAPSAPPIRILLVDSSEADYWRTRDWLDAIDHARFTFDWARDFETGMTRLAEGGFDVCLVDHGLPDRAGLELVHAAQNCRLQVPIIMLTGQATLELDLRAMAEGAADFLDKDRTDARQLERSIRYALARQQQAQHLNHLAQHDELTGLANRALFHERLQRALAAAQAQGHLVAVMVLDLNDFKIVNDDIGHAAGDRLLVVTAKRLRSKLRETDTVARLGGDEFAVVVENLALPEHAARVAQKLLETVVPPALIDGRAVSVTASLGVAVYPRDGDQPTLLMRRADRAMYRAKAEGGNRCRFSSDLVDRLRQPGVLAAADLRRALERDEITLRYQPQIALTARGAGVAAAIQWHHAEAGLVGSDRILALAIEGGVLEPLTDRLLQAACDQLRRWRGLGVEPLCLGLPLLSYHQLVGERFLRRLADRFGAAGVPPSSLEIELSEEQLMVATPARRRQIRAIKELGIRFALADFGRGWAALGPFQFGILDTVKLARRLLDGLPEEPRSIALVTTVLALARELGLRTVADGIDRPGQLTFLREHGCDALQGLMKCPPLPADACVSWLCRAAERHDQRPFAGSPSTLSAGDGQVPRPIEPASTTSLRRGAAGSTAHG